VAGQVSPNATAKERSSEKMDFVDDKIFFGIEKIGFVTGMI